MSRRMIDPQAIIKSQIVNDKFLVDLHELLEKYGTENYDIKNITLQFYSKEVGDDNNMLIESDTDVKGSVVLNTAITISKTPENVVTISGSLVDNLYNMNFLPYIKINDGDYENGIILSDNYEFDIHVVKV